MLINWFTVGAQIVNFLVLLALLKWLLFDRIVRAMDERQQGIAERLDEARRTREEAQQREDELERKHRELDDRRQQLLDEARQEADQRRQELTSQARQEVEKSRQRWHDDLAQQQERFLGEIMDRAGEALAAAIRHALRDLADTELNRQIVRRFSDELGQGDDQQRQQFCEAIEQNQHRVVAAVAGDLGEDERKHLAETVRQLCDNDGEIDLSMDEAPELIAGIELRAGDHALGWNLRQYLDQFDDALRQELQQ